MSFRTHALTTALILAPATPALADDDPLAAAVPLDDATLAEQRGGFRFEGMDIRLGADIKTFLNGELALQTRITIADGEYRQTQIASAALTLADADALRNSVLANGSMTMNIGDQRVYLANEGQTALIQGTDGALQNILVNTASNIDLNQEVNATLEIGGYQMFVSALATDQLRGALGEDIARAINGSFGS